ncbi:MAG: transcriptional regulator [Geobacteraceae bacterium]|nr:transcriptional regulator [Geobacteraceae bacterium]
MRIRNVTEDEVIALSTRDESHFYDRKAKEIKGAKVQKIAVAFANADGGEFIVGIADDKDEHDPSKRWQGAKDLEDLNSHLQVLFAVTPALDVRYEILKCDKRDGLVLRVMIEKTSEVHKTADGTIYQRYGAQSLPVSDPQKITELAFAKGASSFEDQILKDLPPEQVVDSKELAIFLGDYSPKSEPLEFCINQNLLDYKTWEPRVASALLFHHTPSAVMPRKCAVKITRYETKEDDPERDHLASQSTVEGPLNRLINDTVREIQKIMESVTIWTAEGLKKAKYPPESIWEIFVNAVIHRDYAISDDIHVLIFDNRIEVLSPGRLPGYVTVENILDARYSRNPKLVRTLNRYKSPPNRDMGEGLNTAFQKMKEWGLKAPEIVEINGYVRVTLPHTPLAKPTEAILHFLTQQPHVTNRQARDLTGIKSENLVKVEFYKLRDEEFLEQVPELKGPKAAWRLTEKGKKQAEKFK